MLLFHAYTMKSDSHLDDQADFIYSQKYSVCQTWQVKKDAPLSLILLSNTIFKLLCTIKCFSQLYWTYLFINFYVVLPEKSYWD